MKEEDNLFINKMRRKEVLNHLTWIDLLSVTAILFGYFIYASSIYFLSTLDSSSNLNQEILDTTNFTSADDWGNLKIQSVFLIIALLYLWFRRYNFKQLPIYFRWNVIWLAPAIFLFIGLSSDVFISIFGDYNYFNFSDLQLFDFSLGTTFGHVSNLMASAVIYGLFNGFYEEFYFLGLLTSVKEKYRWPVLLFSTIVRTSFHTYQGFMYSIAIGVVAGLLYYILYKYKVKNLLPFFIAHAFADFFGSSFLYLFIPY